MQVAIPHSLGREEARRRLRENSHRMGEAMPGGMGRIDTRWSGEDRLEMAITAMGQSLAGQIDIADTEVILSIDLPPALSFIQPIVEGAIRKQGQALLAPPSG